jgi:SAM-dependent methyltransferase
MSRAAEHWERFGEQDPYYGVLSDDAFRKDQLTPEAMATFFATGVHYVDLVLGEIRRRFEPEFRPGRVLDYGCGVGRLAIPFARHADEVVGVDVAPGMLAEAERNARAQGAANVRFTPAPAFLASAAGTPFDLVNTYITLQHVPPADGERILARLLASVRPGGFAAIHLVHTRPGPAWKRIVAWMRFHVPGVHALGNLAQRRPLGAPYMQMNAYDQNHFLLALQRAGFGHGYAVFTDHGGYLGVLMMAQRAPGAVP